MSKKQKQHKSIVPGNSSAILVVDKDISLESIYKTKLYQRFTFDGAKTQIHESS